MTKADVIAVALLFGVVIAIVAAVGFAMTAKNPRIRFWGCRTAAVLFALFGLFAIAQPLLETASVSGRNSFLFGILLFGVAGWQWQLSTKSR